jgi:hypothetical protein
MPTAAPARECQIHFLQQCLDQLDEEVCKKHPDRKAFIHACLGYFHQNDRLDSEALLDIGEQHTKVGEKTLRNYIKAFIKALEEHEHRLHRDLSGFDLTRFPFLVEHAGGGKGVRSFYEIDLRGPDGELSEEPERPEPGPQAPRPPDNGFAGDRVTYRTEQLKRAPWYLRLGNIFLRTIKRRVWFGGLALLLVYVALPLSIGGLYVLNPSEQYLVWLFAILLGGYFFISGPTGKLLKLITRKIVVVDDIRTPLSAVCISEIAKLPADGEAPNRTVRRLSVVTVSADCPICSRVHGLKQSVQLEQRVLIGGPIIGVCINNPMMHRYSFDKDLMAGERLPLRH